MQVKRGGKVEETKNRGDEEKADRLVYDPLPDPELGAEQDRGATSRVLPPSTVGTRKSSYALDENRGRDGWVRQPQMATIVRQSIVDYLALTGDAPWS